MFTGENRCEVGGIEREKSVLTRKGRLTSKISTLPF